MTNDDEDSDTSHLSLTGKATPLYREVGGSSPPGGSKLCPECDKAIVKPRNKFCNQSCAAKYNNRLYPKRTKREVPDCLQCGADLKKGKYCSHKCQHDYQYEKYIKDWLEDKVNGLKGVGTVSSHVKRWLRETRGDRCEKCGWEEVNPHTGKVPVVADHIDGKWENNRPENLQLICPNCDSLQSTYKAANKGNGRSWRRKLYHDSKSSQ